MKTNILKHSGRGIGIHALFDSLICGFKGWWGDYWRLAVRGDLIDRIVGRYLIPGFVCCAVWLVGDYLLVVIGDKLEQESSENEKQTDVQEKLTNEYFAAGVPTKNYLVGRDVAGEHERVDPDDDSSSEVENKAELLHVLIFLSNAQGEAQPPTKNL